LPGGENITSFRGTLTAESPARVVLVVDDEPDARDVLATVLEEASYKVLRAANGAEALAALTAHDGRCDVILLDLMMPVMNGWDFRRKQKQIPHLADIPVLLMSAGGRIASVRDDLEAADYVTKPVEIPDLLDKVRAQCR
jgi:CheY-like chemotaxis protein